MEHPHRRMTEPAYISISILLTFNLSIMDKIHRKSPLPDAVLYEHGSKVAMSLEDDIDDFSAFDSTIDRGFISKVKGALDNVREVKKDEVMVDEQTQLTDDVNRKMAACNKEYKTIAYFVRYIFGGDGGKKMSLD